MDLASRVAGFRRVGSPRSENSPRAKIDYRRPEITQCRRKARFGADLYGGCDETTSTIGCMHDSGALVLNASIASVIKAGCFDVQREIVACAASKSH